MATSTRERKQGKLVLRARHGTGLGETAIDDLITALLEILTQVTAVERAWAS
jgi:hypothetical protein